ncbi:bacterioferritin [Variovorax guangxiensis]|nr:bacterioferritin [Variovorax guangxiensis]
MQTAAAWVLLPARSRRTHNPRFNKKEKIMKGDPQVIDHLQAQLKNELTAINQYFLHYRMLKHWGLDKLAKKEYEESIGEMKHADKLMDRIFMLDGLPNLQDLAKLRVGEDVPEILQCDLASEMGAQATIKDGIAHCEAVRDYVSRDLLQEILDDTEEHIDFLETQIDLVDKVGLQNYLQSQMGEVE